MFIEFGGPCLSVLVPRPSLLSDICAFWASDVFRVSRLSPGESELWPNCRLSIGRAVNACLELVVEVLV